MDSSNLVNASIVTYVSFTFIFFVLKFRFFPENGYAWIVLFLALSCVFQTVQNINLTSLPTMCGKPDIKMALYSTLVPWVLVFTMFTLCIVTLPGWVRVFSNTFGVFAAEAYGLKETLNRIFQKPAQQSTDPALLQMLENIYSDRMALVLELNTDDVTDGEAFIFPSLDQLVKMNIIQGPTADPATKGTYDNLSKELYHTLLLKDNVGYFFWFLLIGIFCILVSTNSLLSSNCTPAIGKKYEQIFKS